MQVDAHDEPVNLGYPIKYIPSELYRLKSHYLPVGKVGGRPAWLNPRDLPTSQQLSCSMCQKPLCFLAQVYANGPTDPEHAFHRTIYVFVCRDPKCHKPNEASNFVAVRCGLPRRTEFYSFDEPVYADFEGDVPNPYLPSDAPHLCHICGCRATKRCGKCETTWYCAREHQVVDWPSHKVTCGKSEPPGEVQNPENSFLFKEYGVMIEQEYVPANLFDGVSDDEDEDGEDSDDETEEERQKRIKEFNEFVKANQGKNTELTKEELEAAAGEEKKDAIFEKFSRLVNLNPDQIIRYKRFGEPLKATESAPFPSVEQIPSCSLCGAPRRFEMQLMPYVLSLIDVDTVENSIDWASVYIFTCSASCRIENDGYALEFVCKQDFS